MTTLQNRPRTALLVVDAQNAVLAGTHRREEAVAAIATAVARARAAGAPVVWVQDTGAGEPGSTDREIAAGLDPAGGEPRIEKSYPDSFDDTDLEPVLAGLRVGSLVVAGAQSDMCIRATLHGAVARGYDALLVEDAHTTEDLTAWGAPPPEAVIAHTNLYWSGHTSPGRTAATAPSSTVDFGAADA